MPLQASTDRDMGRAGARQREHGGRLLLLAAVLLGVGLLLMVLFDGGILDFAGVVLATLSAIPAIAGAGLLLSGLVSGRASRRKPFA